MNSNKIFFIFLMITGAIQVSAQWTSVSPAPQGFITDHSVGFALNGKGYLATGTDELGNIRADIYEYDPLSDDFTRKANFPGGARGFSIGDTWNGKAYIGFGVGANFTYLNDLWEYDQASDSWTELPSCPCTPRYHPAFIAHNDKIFVGMGSSPNGNLNDWWIFDMATNTWSQGPNLPSVTRHHPYQFAIGDYVYAGFGHGNNGIYNDWYRFDPANNTWTEMAPLPAEGRVAGQQFSYDGKGYILSGEGDDHNAMDDGEFWEYDPESNSWAAMPSHPGTSRWAPATFVIDGEAYLFNGIVYGFGPPTSVEQAFKYTFESVMSSIPDLRDNDKVELFPNPVSDQLIIESHTSYNSAMSIVDMFGRTILEFDYDIKKIINTSDIPNGSYFLRSKDGKLMKPFVVMH